MKKSLLYQPFKIRNIEIKNRVVMAPGANLLCSDTGVMTQEGLEWAKARAKGGIGVVGVGQSMVNPTPPAMSGFVIDLTTDKSINGMFRMTEMIRQMGAKSTIELVYMDFGDVDRSGIEMSEEDLSKIRTEDSTGINDKLANKMPEDLTIQQINKIVGYYVDAAVRCKRAGFDMVLVHGAHGMFISDFLSPVRNRRTDQYGGSFENRCRIVDDILTGIRGAVGPDMAIEYRLSAEEKKKDGLTLNDQLAFARHIQEKIDILYVSAGVMENDEAATFIFPPAYYERGVNVHYAKHFRDSLKIPVGTVGGIDMALAERIVDEGKADVVTMLRAAIADPHLVNKARLGKYDEIRPCVRCNTCINQPHYFFLPVRCAVNPEAGRECDVLRIPHPRKSKKIVVIGGGPSGMEAARTAAGRGHKVTLFEKGIELGGMLKIAAAGKLKRDLRAYLDWAVRETVKNPDITLKLGTTATYDMVKAHNPDAVIVSVGANPFIPQIPGINGKNSLWAGDVESGRAFTGKRVIIAGGGLTGLETALSLSREGKEVTIIEMMPFERVIMSAPLVNMVALSMLIREQGVRYLAETTLLEVAENRVMVKDSGGNKIWMECDTLVHALGMKPDRVGALLFEDTADEVYYTGDCAVTRGNLWTATSTAHFTALEI